MDGFRFRPPPTWSLVVFLLPLVPLRVGAAEQHPVRPSATETAAKLDAALVRGLAADVRLPVEVDDETFLRRVCLDLTGKLPEPEALRRFAADNSTDKRT